MPAARTASRPRPDRTCVTCWSPRLQSDASSVELASVGAAAQDLAGSGVGERSVVDDRLARDDDVAQRVERLLAELRCDVADRAALEALRLRRERLDDLVHLPHGDAADEPGGAFGGGRELAPSLRVGEQLELVLGCE